MDDHQPRELRCVYDLWEQGRFMEALAKAWRLPRLYRYPALQRIDLRDLIIRPCQAAVAAAQQGQANEVEQWVRGLLDTLPPPALIDHDDGRDAKWCQHYRQRMLRAPLLGTCAALKRQWTSRPVHALSTEDLRPVADETGFPMGLLYALIHEILEGQPRPALRNAVLTVLLVDQHSGTGVFAQLALEQVVGGLGALYPATSQAFVPRNWAWRAAEKNAYRYVRQAGLGAPHATAIRWCLRRRDEPPLPLVLKGGSIGAAFALGLLKIWAGEAESASPTLRMLQELDLAPIAITAVVRRDGSLHRVEQLAEKLHAAGRATVLLGLRIVVVAEEQRADLEQDYPHLLQDDPNADLRVICAGTLEEAIQSLVQWQHWRVASRSQGPPYVQLANPPTDPLAFLGRNPPQRAGHCTECERLQERLAVAVETLHACKVQIACYTRVSAPLHLLHSERAASKEVERIKSELADHRH